MVSENGWFFSWKSENPIKIHDLGVPLFLETLTSRIDDSEMFCDSCANASNIPVLHTVCNRGVGDVRTHGVSWGMFSFLELAHIDDATQHMDAQSLPHLT